MGSPIASTKELIDDIIIEYHQVPEEKVTLLSIYNRHRRRILRNAQFIANETYFLRDWSFRYKTDPAFVISDKDNNLTADWAHEGAGGYLFIPAIQKRVPWRPLWDINLLYNEYPADQMSGQPRYFTVYTEASSPPQPLLRVWPKPDMPYTCELFFSFAQPILEDTISSPGGLDFFPARWREQVIYPGTVMLEMRDKGDIQGLPIQKAIYDTGRFGMCREEQQGQSEPSFMPRYAGSANVFEID